MRYYKKIKNPTENYSVGFLYNKVTIEVTLLKVLLHLQE